MIINVTLEPGEEQRQRHQHIEKAAGVVMVTLTYSSPRYIGCVQRRVMLMSVFFF